MAGATEKIDLVYDAQKPMYSKTKASLDDRLEEIKDKQGFLGSIWNGFKETFNVGQSESDCESMLEKYKDGEISFEEAAQYLEAFDKKQENMTNLFANVLTGVGAITTTVCTMGTGTIGALAALKFGAPVGALMKTSLKTLDRATNNTDGDAIDLKQMVKDSISGAVTGATSAVSSGVGAGIKTGKFGLSVANGVKCGLACGAVSGSATYLTDALLEDDVDFNIEDLAKTTALNAFVSGTVGGVVGGGMYGGAQIAGNIGSTTAKTTGQVIVSDSTASSARKVLGQTEKNILAA